MDFNNKTEMLKYLCFNTTDMNLGSQCSLAGLVQPFTWLVVFSSCGQYVSRYVEERTCEYRHMLGHVRQNKTITPLTLNVKLSSLRVRVCTYLL